MRTSFLIPAFALVALCAAQFDPEQCGPSAGNQKCKDNKCCSQYGWCGKSKAYCGTGCQGDFGACSALSTPPAVVASPSGSSVLVSKDGRCGSSFGGQTCQGSEFGNCCSQYNWCGKSKKHCNVGCQSPFGTCSSSSSSSSMAKSSSTNQVPSSSASSNANAAVLVPMASSSAASTSTLSSVTSASSASASAGSSSTSSGAVSSSASSGTASSSASSSSSTKVSSSVSQSKTSSTSSSKTSTASSTKTSTKTSSSETSSSKTSIVKTSSTTSSSVSSTKSSTKASSLSSTKTSSLSSTTTSGSSLSKSSSVSTSSSLSSSGVSSSVSRTSSSSTTATPSSVPSGSSSSSSNSVGKVSSSSAFSLPVIVLPTPSPMSTTMPPASSTSTAPEAFRNDPLSDRSAIRITKTDNMQDSIVNDPAGAAPSGSSSYLKITTTNSNDAELSLDTKPTVQSGNKYTVSMWIKSSVAASGCSVDIVVDEVTISSSNIPAEWTEITGDYEATDAAPEPTLSVVLTCSGSAVADRLVRRAGFSSFLSSLKMKLARARVVSSSSSALSIGSTLSSVASGRPSSTPSRTPGSRPLRPVRSSSSSKPKFTSSSTRRSSTLVTSTMSAPTMSTPTMSAPIAADITSSLKSLPTRSSSIIKTSPFSASNSASATPLPG